MVPMFTFLSLLTAVSAVDVVTYGPRPFFLIDDMSPSELKTTLKNCVNQTPKPSLFSIGHRGAPVQFPEHTKESYVAAARTGAGILECDVTFTKDKQLVCRHAQCDLHTTTNILATDLATKCSEPFKQASEGSPASAKCCASDITLAEFKTLIGKMDAFDANATTVDEYLGGTAGWRTEWYSSLGNVGTLLSHAESIELFRELGTKYTPELKSPEVQMPFDGFTQDMYAQKLVDEYKNAGVPPEDVWVQSFNIRDVKYWIANEPRFGNQAVYLDDRYDSGIDPSDPDTFEPSMADIYQSGIRIIGPPMWFLLTTNEENKVVPSAYAKAAYESGLDIITWTFERSGAPPSGWYYQSYQDAVKKDGDAYTVLDVLAKQVKVLGIFTDWPATTTYYANCMGL